ncbi:MAG TPA: hypothetical protein VFM53_00325 [Anaeromyxobacteraceae bacterium]|nr:hypothetical protein [Anaeromyxobacteraceae bacterium]
MATTPPVPGTGRPGGRQIAGWIIAALVALVFAVALLKSQGAEGRAIERMDPAERRAVYANAYGELVRLCGVGPRDDALEARCQEQIRFVTQFPECDAQCQAIAARHARRPTK